MSLTVIPSRVDATPLSEHVNDLPLTERNKVVKKLSSIGRGEALNTDVTTLIIKTLRITADAHDLPFDQEFDLVLADPPYSIEDCDHYGTVMIKRNKVLEQASKSLQKGGHIVWLDQVLPMYRKAELKTTGYIGMVKSTNHRFRVITIFEKQ